MNWDGSVREGETPCIHMPGKNGLYLKQDAPGIMIDAALKSIQRAVYRMNIPGGVFPQHLVPHQANGAIIQLIREQLEERDICDVQVWDKIKNMGNTSACTIPTTMSLMQDDIQPGEYAAMPSIGAGSPRFKRKKLVEGWVLVKKVQ